MGALAVSCHVCEAAGRVARRKVSVNMITQWKRATLFTLDGSTVLSMVIQHCLAKREGFRKPTFS